MYREKYLKYKKKYINLKNQIGGELFYLQSNKFDNSMYKILKYSDDRTKFELIESPSNAFEIQQKTSMDNFVKYILPSLKINGEKLSQEDIENINVMGTGQFGITLQTKNLIIKIIRAKTDTYKFNAANEVNIMYNLCIKNTPPENIAKFYCYFTADDYIGRKLSELDKNLISNLAIPNFYTNLTYNETMENCICSKLPQIIGTDLLSKDMIFILMEKGETNAIQYFQNIPGTELIKNVIKFTKDIITGLNYVHKIGYLHNDVKLDNIIVKKGIFKLIDFGITMKLKSDKPVISFNIGSPIYFVSTSFFSQRSELYDYHCLFVSLLLILRIIFEKDMSREGYLFSQILSKEIEGSVNKIDVMDKTEKIIKYFTVNLNAHIGDKNDKIIILNLLIYLMYSHQLWKNIQNKKIDYTKIPQIDNSVITYINVKTIQEYEDAIMKLIK
jgi:serine/threonine protein kinase